jgi:hypothetical protein
MVKRLIWTLFGCLIGLLAGFVLQYAFHTKSSFLIYFFPSVGGSVFIWIAERKGKVATIEELRRPISIFNERPPQR